MFRKNRPLQHPLQARLVVTQHDAGSFHQDRTLDQVGVCRHQAQGLFPRRRAVLHVAFTIQLVPGIQEEAVVAGADQLVELAFGKALAEIDLLKLRALFAKP